MSLLTRVEWFVAIYMIASGLSLLVRADLWIAFMKSFAQREDKGIIFGFGALIFGCLIVLTHNIWVLDIPVIITVLGWAGLIKGFVILLAPEKTIAMGEKFASSLRALRVAGFFYAVLGGVIVAWLLTRPV